MTKGLKRAAELYSAFTGQPAKVVEEWYVPASLNAPAELVKIGGLVRLEADGLSVGFDPLNWILATNSKGKGLYILGFFDTREIMPVFGVGPKSEKAFALTGVGYQANHEGQKKRFFHTFDNPPTLIVSGKNKHFSITGGKFRFTDCGIVG